MTMADDPEMVIVDPDAPTDISVKQTLANLPTWGEWLEQHEFTPHPATSYEGFEWDRRWPDQGRGWRIKVMPTPETISIAINSGVLVVSRRNYGKRFDTINVAERSVPKVIQRLITEIERPVSDATKKRRIRAYCNSIPWEDREDKQVKESATPPPEPNPDDPTPEAMERAMGRIRTRCYPIGQRVRVTSRIPSHCGENCMGTVVSASDHACYVALDAYVEAGDPDPFRFAEGEVVPVYESQEPDPDAPDRYIAGLDYMSPLRQAGYSLIASTYRKNIPLGEKDGRLKITVEPQKEDVAAIIYVDYLNHNVGEERTVQSIIAPSPYDVLDLVREIEAVANQADNISEFADLLRAKNLAGTPVVNTEHLYYIFGESLEPAPESDPDDPTRYIEVQQRHSEIINAFRQHGLKMGRMMSVNNPYYRMFWIRSAVADVSYDIFITPQPDGSWEITAEGNKEFQDPRTGNDFQQEFDIESNWTIAAGSNVEEIASDVDDILADLARNSGPEEPTISEPDVDDLGEAKKPKEPVPAPPPAEVLPDAVLDDPAPMVARAKTAKMGDIVDIVCPKCGDKHQSIKNWPDNAPREWGFPCPKCNGFIPLVNVTLESEDDIDHTAYADDTLTVDNTLTKLGYQYCWNTEFPYWFKHIEPTEIPSKYVATMFCVFVRPEDYKWSFQAYRPTSDGKWGLKTSSPGRHFRTLKFDLELWEQQLRDGTILATESIDDVDPAAYAATTNDPHQFLEANGWALHSQQHWRYYAKTFPLPREYQLGGMTFTGIQVRIGLDRSLFKTSHVGLYMVGADNHGLGMQSYELRCQWVYPWGDEETNGSAPDKCFDSTMTVRRFAQGIERVIANAKWPENRTAALLASNAVMNEVGPFVKRLNQDAEQPLYPDVDITEAIDPDAPEGAVNQLTDQTYVKFVRRHDEDDEMAQENFPGLPLDQALPQQLLAELKESLIFDMNRVKVASFEQPPDRPDIYIVRLLFIGQPSDATLRNDLYIAIREVAVAGEFEIENFRPEPKPGAPKQARCRHCDRYIRQENGVWVDPEATGDDSVWRETCDAHDTFAANHEPMDYYAEALDPDDPNLSLQSHPGFHFQHTSFMGEKVYAKEPGEVDIDDQEWPKEIGNVLLGPEPDPPYQRQRWYVIHIRGIAQYDLCDYGLGIAKVDGKIPPLQTFATKEEAAMAIWLVRSRMEEVNGPVMGKRRVPRKGLPESEDVDAPDLEHWGSKLGIEDKLTRLYGKPFQAYKDDPGYATGDPKAIEWAAWFRNGEFEVWSKFIIHYKVKNAPSAIITWTIEHGTFKHHDSEMLHGRDKILKLVEYVERGVEKLKLNPPTKVTDVNRVWMEILRYAYTAEQDEHYDVDI